MSRLLLAVLLLLPVAGLAAERPAIAILIDDIGDRLAAGRAAVDLPGPVAYAFLPRTPYSGSLAERAHARGKEVLLHLPMQAVKDGPLGPGAVTLHMDKVEFLRVVRENLADLPHVSGVNNHMGSLLTRHPGHMSWLMQELRRHGRLFYVDSRTTAHTVAERMAVENGVPVLRRHVFLDHDPSEAEVELQFERLLTLARRQGRALAIGHPYPSTLTVLGRRLPTLSADGVDLISLQEMLRRQAQPERWQAAVKP